MTIFPVHGFLQTAQDWREIPWPSGVAIEATDLWRDLSEIPFSANAFKKWAEKFNSRVKKISGPKCLVGYSLGGRLAMHAIKDEPGLFASCILVSANPGLQLQSERDQRLKQDLLWAERFQTTPWPQLLKDWNAQAVFAVQIPQGAQGARGRIPEHLETDFSRPSLVRALDQWSLGRQEDLRSALGGRPTLLISGHDDVKFRGISEELGLIPGVRHVILENAGHRVPWEQPRAFSDLIREFIEKRNA